MDLVISPGKASANPTIYLVKGYTYVFEIGSSDHPFWIKSVATTDASNGIATGPGQMLDYNGFEVGNMTLVIPPGYSGTNPLFYNCEYHTQMQGVIHIVDTPAEAAASIHAFSILVLMASVAFVSMFV